jgi:hypothetical protein
MPDFVIGHDAFFLIGQNGIFLLVAGDDDFHTFLKISLTGGGTTIADSPQGRFIDDVGQFRAGGAGSQTGDRREITSSASLIFLAWTFRMASRPFKSGNSTGTRRSKRPGWSGPDQAIPDGSLRPE